MLANSLEFKKKVEIENKDSSDSDIDVFKKTSNSEDTSTHFN